MIGIFDSGVGGLSIYREIKTLIPETHYIYFSDNAHFPYGEKSEEEIKAYAYCISSFLIDKGAELIVTACNSATVSSINYLRNSFSVPFVGVVPPVKPAVQSTKSGKIAVLLTEASSKGKKYQELIETWANGVNVISIQFPLLVKLVEDGMTEITSIKSFLFDKLERLKNMGVDTIVLGCTHFIFLKEIIISMFGDTFTVLDPATAVAKQTLKLYSEIRTEKPVSNSQNEDLFYTSGDIESFGRFIKKWLKLDTEKVYKIDLECLKN